MKFIGLDIGTTSVCGILADGESGRIIRSVTKPNNSFLPTENVWEKIQDVSPLSDSVKDILNGLSENETISAVGVTGQMHGIVYLDKSGKEVSPLYIWQDGRGNLPYRDGLTYAEYLSRATGYPLSTGYGAVTHFYNTVNGLVPKEAVTFCTVHDFAVMKLTGRKTPLVHPSDAASFGFYDLKNGCFDKDAIQKAGMDIGFFPQISGFYEVAGKTGGGIPVSVAIGDNQASFIGSVKDTENSILINVGTGSQISACVSRIPSGNSVDVRPLEKDRYLIAGSSLCGGRAYSVLEKFLRDTVKTVTGKEIESAYPVMDRLMENFTPPHKPLTVDTRFSGTRKEPDVKGEISGITVSNLTVENLCDGFMNGMVKELFGMYEEILPLLDKKPSKAIGSGNGIRFNLPLKKKFSDAFKTDMAIPCHREEAAFGAVLFAMTAAGFCKNLTAAQALIRYEGE